MDLAEFVLLTTDTYEAFGQKPPPARTLERLWDRETALLAAFPSSRLDEALRALTRDETRSRITPRDILNTLRTISKHRPRSTDGARIVDKAGTYDGGLDFEWQLLRDAKDEATRTGEPWGDVMERLRTERTQGVSG